MTELEALRQENAELKRRWEFIRGFARGGSPHMNGTFYWSFRMPANFECRARTPEEALALSMEKYEQHLAEFDAVWPGLRKPE